jgi:hypothetical protein
MTAQVLKQLPLKLRKALYQHVRMEEHQQAFDSALVRPEQVLQGLPNQIPARAATAAKKHLDAASAELAKALEAFQEKTKSAGRAFMASQGIAPGAVIELTYPLYTLLLDEARERLVGTSKVVLQVEHFSIARASSVDAVALAVHGRAVGANGRFLKASKEYRLEPGYEVRIVREAA